ncbi:MAG: PKD domain-containing protein [Candidatus Thermoplasmatota archaeon]|nr:PKD domain-containing protein [Candidatus Thermoplasmatota archaeon]MDD5778437.1 PKD domain-containing protein [Candidatus Thermoplasmatota archaeon]
MKQALAIIVLTALVFPSVLAFSLEEPASAALNDPPARPTLTGPANGDTGTTYTYTAVTTDPDGDQVFYCFDWGDGTDICTPLHDSGQQAQASHAWDNDGTYTITVKATDQHGAESPPATLTVSMPLEMQGPDVRIVKPRNGIYAFGFKLLPILGQVVIGDLTVEARTSDDVIRVEFLLQMTCGCGREVVHVDTTPPFTWEWSRDYDDDDLLDEGNVPLMVRAYNGEYESASDSIRLIKMR